MCDVTTARSRPAAIPRASGRFAIACTRRVLSSAGVLALVALANAAADPASIDAARELFHERGKSAEAQQAFEAILAKDPRSAPALFHLGRLAYRRDDMPQALGYLERAVALAPNDSEIHRALGDTYGRSAQKASVFSQLGLAKKCLASYQKAVQLDPRNIEAHQSLFEYYRRAPGFAGGSREKALAQCATIKQLDPLRGRIAFATLYSAEKKYDAALAEFDEAVRANPDDYAAHYQIGRLAVTTGQFLDRGVASLRRCLALTPPADQPGHASVQWRLGQLAEKKGDRDDARAAYEAALRLDPRLTAAATALEKLR